jgi:hypothetical protein
MTFERARELADALFSAEEVGVLAPPGWAAPGGESTWQETDCLASAGPDAQLVGCVRFQRLRSRSVEEIRGKHDFRRVPRLELGDRELTSAKDATSHELDFALPVSPQARSWRFVLPSQRRIERFRSDDARLARFVYEQERCEVAIRVAVQPLAGAPSLHRIRLRVENLSQNGPFADRSAALHSALLRTHVLLAVSGGDFLSQLDPPEHLRATADGCANVGTWPVLVGSRERSGVLLSAPIALPDHPDANAAAALAS